jgi:glutamate carboxypeptidase
MRCALVAATVFMMSAPAYCASLTPTENDIVKYVKQDQQNQLQLLEKLTNIQSGTLNTKGVLQTGEVVRKELKRLGFKTIWANEPAVMQRPGTLIAIHPGKQGKRLLLIGHLDTVFSNKIPFKKYTQTKNVAKGQGVIDDKGGIVVMLSALKAMQQSGALNNVNITIVLTGDEEDSGKPSSISRKPLLTVAKNSDVALDFEPSITFATATVARRGISNWTLTTSGNASHSATIFQDNVGAGAILGAANLLNEMRLKLQSVPNFTFNPGMILGGTTINYQRETASGTAAGKENVVASVAMVKGDMRYIDSAQKDAMQQKMRDIAAVTLPGVKAEIEFVDGIPPMSPTENNMKILNEYSQVSIDLGQGKVVALPAGLRGAGDISYVSNIVPANLSGLGPVGLGSHTVLESIEVESLVPQTERAALLIYRLTR